jgi:glycosyltransferase involved in cell wall biosynthesis
MKLLWGNSSFLHPTTRGGQIRTLGMLRQLHKRHEIHYAALADPAEPEGVQRAGEYCSRVIAVEFRPVSKRSPAFALELARGVFSSLPMAISRWESASFRDALARLMRDERYDAAVCDFLVTAVNFPQLERAALFQHNVESVLWKRRAEAAGDLPRKNFFRMQARRMLAFEQDACRRAAQVIAVSETDAATIRSLFGVAASAVATGVDIEYFHPPERTGRAAEGLVFVGSMDWMPNIDGILWFAREVLPLIRARRKDLPVVVVGRTPPPAVRALANGDPNLHVAGTVPDVRPYLWNAAVSIVPLRIGGGTRLKIYEAMAAGIPVVSTTVGAEGLEVADGETIVLADDPGEFARRCLDLVDHEADRRRIGRTARDMVASRFSWEQVSRQFERLLISSQPA